MKRLVLLALSVVSTLALLVPVKAQDYAPLVQRETVTLARLDLTKLSSEKLSSQAEKLGNAAIDYFVNDPQQAKDAKQIVPVVKIFIPQYFETFIQPLKDAGVDVVYFVFEKSDDDETMYPYAAILTESLSKDQVEKARDAMKRINQQTNSSLKWRFVRNGVFYSLLAPSTEDADDVKEYVKKRFTKISPVEKPEFKEAFDLADPEAALVVASLPRKNAVTSEEIDAAFSMLDLPDEEAAEKTKDFINKLAEVSAKCIKIVKYSVTSVNADSLEIVSKVVAGSEEDAKQYADLLNNDVVNIVSDLVGSASEHAVANGEESNITKEERDAAVAAIKDALKVVLKLDVDGNVAVWKLNEKFWSDNKQTFDNLVDKIGAIAQKAQDEEQVDEVEELDGEDEELDLDEEEDDDSEETEDDSK